MDAFVIPCIGPCTLVLCYNNCDQICRPDKAKTEDQSKNAQEGEGDGDTKAEEE